jgi:hypothetical protein
MILFFVFCLPTVFSLAQLAQNTKMTIIRYSSSKSPKNLCQQEAKTWHNAGTAGTK